MPITALEASSACVRLAERVETVLNTAKTNTDFTNNTFNVTRTYEPVFQRTEIESSIEVFIIPLAFTIEEILTRGSKRARVNLPVEIAIQKGLQAGAGQSQLTTEIDALILHTEQIRHVVRQDANNGEFSFVRTEHRVDQNGQPLNYVGLRNAHTFESYLIHHFHYFTK